MKSDSKIALLAAGMGATLLWLMRKQKATSGIGVLTWIEDAAAHVAQERDAAAARQRAIEADEKAAAARKRLQKTRRQSQQMSLFGCKSTGKILTEDFLELELLNYLRRYIDAKEIDETLDEISETREPLSRVNRDLENQIIELTEDWCANTATDPDSIWDIADPEDILWVL